MAARRLVVVMLVLLFVSSLAAALAPVQPTSEEPAPDPVVPAPITPIPQAGTLVEATVAADAEEAPTISVSVGDQLRLGVSGRRPGTVELVGLGPVEDFDRFAPAHFDVLLTEPGTYPVRLLGEGRVIATIEAKRPVPAAPEPPS